MSNHVTRLVLVLLVTIAGSAAWAAARSAAVASPDSPSSAICRGLPATIVGTAAGEAIVGTTGRDVIVGQGGDDTIDAGAGDDVVCAGDGSDKVEGGPGDDVLDGEDGDDSVEYAQSPAGVMVDLRLSADQATGGAGTDQLASFMTVVGSPEADTLVGIDTNPRELDEKGEPVRTEILEGEGGDDTLRGDGGTDELVGGDGKDALDPGAGPDYAFGDAGADTVRARDGRGGDYVDCGSGRDTAALDTEDEDHACEKVTKDGMLRPDTILSQHPARRVRSGRRGAKLEFMFDSSFGSEGARFECRVDKHPYRRCLSPFERLFKPGRHRFDVRAMYQGLRDPSPATFRFSIAAERKDSMNGRGWVRTSDLSRVRRALSH